MATNLNLLKMLGIDNTLPKTKEAIEAKAKELLALTTRGGELSNFWGRGHIEAWANKALKTVGSLDKYTSDPERQTEILDKAYDALFNKSDSSSGRVSGNMAKIETNYAEQVAKEEKRYKNAMENIANKLAGSGFTPEQALAMTPEERASNGLNYLDSQIQDLGKAQDNLKATGATYFGYEMPELTLRQDARGNYVYSSFEGEEPQPGEVTAGSRSHVGEPVGMRQADDGTWEVYGTTSGEVYKSGLANATDANAAATQFASGSGVSVSGRPDLFYQEPPEGQAIEPYVDEYGNTITPRVMTDEEREQFLAGTLPSYNEAYGITDEQTGGVGTTSLGGVDTTGLSDEAIADLNAIWTGLIDSDIGMELLTQTVLTDEDMAEIMNKAREQITGSGSYYEQSFNRALESFNASLSYSAEQREIALAQSKLEATMANEQLTAQETEAGRAFSGMRALSEERLNEQLENVAESSELQFNEQMRQLGYNAEELLGSEALAKANIPTINGQQIFTPTGGVRGELERAAETDVQLTADQLAREEAINRLIPLAAEEFGAGSALDELVNQL